MMRTRMAVVGVGHLGKEHARILASLADVELAGVADVNLVQAQAIAQKYKTQAFRDYRSLLDQVDAASIVVPTAYHLEVARQFLCRGIPVLIEKPLALDARQSQELVELANENGAILQVGHIEQFNPAFEDLAARTFVPRYIRAERLGPFTGRSTDIGIVLDLMIHDLDLTLSLIDSPLRSVEAVGLCCYGGHEDIANARLTFANGCVADLTASRASPTQSRRMQLWGAEGYAELDFASRKLTLVQPSEHVRRYGLDPAALDAPSRARIREDLFTRHLEMTTIDGKAQDQLTCELREFVRCVQSGTTPRVSGETALKAMTVADQILASLRRHRWDRGQFGPQQFPPPCGLLFPHPVAKQVA